MADLDDVRAQYHRALEAFVRGDPEPVAKLWSKRHDVTLANPLGPPALGWDAVRATMERAASQLRDGEAFSVECIATYATNDLAYELKIERCRVKSVAPTKRPRVLFARRTYSDARMTAGGSSIAMPIRSPASDRLSRWWSRSPWPHPG